MTPLVSLAASARRQTPPRGARSRVSTCRVTEAVDEPRGDWDAVHAIVASESDQLRRSLDQHCVTGSNDAPTLPTRAVGTMPQSLENWNARLHRPRLAPDATAHRPTARRSTASHPQEREEVKGDTKR